MSVVFNTLTHMSKLDRLNSWVYNEISPYIGNRVLEAGCGYLPYISHLVDKEVVAAVDNNPLMLDALKKRRGFNVNVRAIEASLDDLPKKDLLNLKLDTIICLNTLEHIKDDIEVLRNFNSILSKGHLVLLVPAFEKLYCSLDKAAGHYRRYQLKEISEKVESCGFEIQKKMYFNLFGILGWIVNGKILKKERLSNKLLSLFNSFLPFFNFLEKLVGPPFGLSIILICRKAS